MSRAAALTARAIATHRARMAQRDAMAVARPELPAIGERVTYRPFGIEIPRTGRVERITAAQRLHLVTLRTDTGDSVTLDAQRLRLWRIDASGADFGA